jgi:hypothetical protein
MTPDGDTSISLKNLYANMLNMYRFNSPARRNPEHIYDQLLVNIMSNYNWGATWRAALILEVQRRQNQHEYQSFAGDEPWEFTFDNVLSIVTRVVDLHRTNKLTGVPPTKEQVVARAKEKLERNKDKQPDLKKIASVKEVTDPPKPSKNSQKKAKAAAAAVIAAAAASKEDHKHAAPPSATTEKPSPISRDVSVCGNCYIIHAAPFNDNCQMCSPKDNTWNVGNLPLCCPRRMQKEGDGLKMAIYLVNKISRHSKQWPKMSTTERNNLITKIKEKLKVPVATVVTANSVMASSATDDYSSGDDSFYDENEASPEER